MVHLLAGFESNIAAHGAALGVSAAARERGVDVSGAAVARRDTLRGVHLDPLDGYGTPPHVFAALDEVVEPESTLVSLRPGQTVLILSLCAAEDVIATLMSSVGLDRHGVLWAKVVVLARG